MISIRARWLVFLRAQSLGQQQGSTIKLHLLDFIQYTRNLRSGDSIDYRRWTNVFDKASQEAA